MRSCSEMSGDGDGMPPGRLSDGTIDGGPHIGPRDSLEVALAPPRLLALAFTVVVVAEVVIVLVMRAVDVDAVQDRSDHARVDLAEIVDRAPDEVLVVLVVLDDEGDHVRHGGEDGRVREGD